MLVSWTRTIAKSTVVASYTIGERPVVGIEALGIEIVKNSPPLYQAGEFYIIDTVKDLEFVVMGPGNRKLRTIRFDFEEAIKTANDFNKLYKETK